MIHTHCPDCDRPSEWPEDSTVRDCVCGWTRVKLRVALPLARGNLSESLWAKPLGDDRYEVDTVLIEARGLNPRDVVEARVPRGRPESLLQVVRVVERRDRTSFIVRFVDGREGDADAFLARLPGPIGRDRIGKVHGVDVATQHADRARAMLDEAREQGLLNWADTHSACPGRFDDPYEDLLGRPFLALKVPEGSAREVPERTPISDAELEAELWEGFGFAAGSRPERLRLRMLGPADVRHRSAGLVELPRTINPETLMPKHKGLFDPALWGHTAGRGADGLLEIYVPPQTEVYRWEGYYGACGHVELPFPVQHPWFPDRSHPALTLQALPILPPGLRPVFVRDGRVAAAGVNWLYMFLIDRLCQADLSEVTLRAAVEAVLMNEATPQPLTRAGKPVESVRKQLGSDPRSQFLALDRLVAEGQAVDGPLPQGVFSLVRALEASAVGVEARTVSPTA